MVILLCLAATIVPHFLDAVYYRGGASAHFDGTRFFNPDGNDTLAPPTGGNRGNFLIRYLTGSDGRPDWPDHVAVVPRDPPARVEGKAMVVTWVGHASVLVQTQGLNILTDPILSETAGPLGIGPKRVAEPGIAFDKLPKIDLVLVSHNHYDHMDLATLKRLWDRDRPVIVTSLGNDSVIAQAGVEARALDWGGRIDVTRRDSKPLRCDPAALCPEDSRATVIVTRNHHWGSRWFTDRNRALWSSFVVQLPGGNVFFAGDTGAGDLKWADEAAAYGPIRLALIPIGAFRFTPGQMAVGSHIGPVDAVEVARRLRAARSIGIHWGTFRLSSEAYDTPPKLLAASMRCTGQGGHFDTVALGVPTAIAPYVLPRAAPVMSRSALLDCLDTPAVHALR